MHEISNVVAMKGCLWRSVYLMETQSLSCRVFNQFPKYIEVGRENLLILNFLELGNKIPGNKFLQMVITANCQGAFNQQNWK